VRKAAIEALTYPTTAYKEGFVPPGAINWNGADDNNAFHVQWGPLVSGIPSSSKTVDPKRLLGRFSRQSLSPV
jgi:hypothetical protein